MVKNLSGNAGGVGSIPGPGRSFAPWSTRRAATKPVGHNS